MLLAALFKFCVPVPCEFTNIDCLCYEFCAVGVAVGDVALALLAH